MMMHGYRETQAKGPHYAYNHRGRYNCQRVLGETRILTLTTTAMSTSTPLEITVLYFAAASTATGLTSERVSLPSNEPLPLTSLADLLVSRHPKTNLEKVLASSQWSVGEEMVEVPEKVQLKGGEEVAVICPVSGG